MKVFIISDTHFPFQNKKAYKRMMAALRKEKPTHVVQIGDLLDQYVFSKYTRGMDITPGADVEKGLVMAALMWEEIQKAVPNVKCFQLLGNHDVRLSKRVMEKLPELADFFGIRDMYKFQGVKVLDSDRDYLLLGGVVYVHGWLSKSLDHARHFNCPTVHGHRHRPCIEVEGKLWSMDVGFMADEKSAPLSYTMNKLTKWRMAYGIVEDGRPRLELL